MHLLFHGVSKSEGRKEITKVANQGILLTAAASLLWATVFVAIEVGLRYSNPYDLMFMRFLVSSVVTLPVVLLFEKKLGVFSEMKKPVVWAMSMVYLAGFLFQYAGQSLTNASDTTLISNMGPIMAPIGAFLLLGERPRAAQGIAVVLGLGGLLLIALPNFTGSFGGLGDFFLFLTSVSYAAFIVVNKKYGSGGLGSSLAMIFVMTIYSIPVAIFEGFDPLTLKVPPVGWFAILWMAIPCTVVAIALYLSGLSKVSVTVSSMLLLLQVLVGLVLANLLLGEELGYAEGIGALLIFASVVLASARLGSGVQKKDVGVLNNAQKGGAV